LYLAVFLVDGRIYVLENQCLHVQSPIDGGPIIDGAVRCPWHGWAYDLETGDLLTAFGNRPGLRTYEAMIDEGMVKVEIAVSVED